MTREKAVKIHRLFRFAQNGNLRRAISRLAKIPKAGEYLAYFPVLGIERNEEIRFLFVFYPHLE